jgi:Winged helix-turn helix
MPNRVRVLVVRDRDRAELERRARSKAEPARVVARARIVLLAEQELTGPQIAERVGCTEPTVITWRRRYAERDLAGLEDAPRPGGPVRVMTPGVQAQVLADAVTPPPESLQAQGVSHWSARDSLKAPSYDDLPHPGTRKYGSLMIKKTIVRVSRFGGPEVLQLEERTLGAVPRSRVRVRVTHVSVGSTDALARRGGYLLQPRPGFTPGYDLVGVVEESTAAGERLGLHAGMRVAGCLARMGSYATYVDVYPSHLVRVPDLLPSDIAAAVSLDVVTAGLALRLARLSRGGRLLVQGVAGAVGTLLSRVHCSRT